MKIAWLNFRTTLKRYKASSLLNIIGLAMAFTACYIITARVWREVTWNDAFIHADRTVLVTARNMFSSDSSNPTVMPYLARPTMERVVAESPEVEAYAAVTFGWDGGWEDDVVWVRRRGALEPEKFDLGEDPVAFSVSPGLLELLPFRTVAGDLNRMAEPHTAIIARSEAERLGVGVGALLYVGRSECDGEGYEVVGIFEDLPGNGFYRSLKYLCDIGEWYMQDAFVWNTFYFLRLTENADRRQLVERMDAIDCQVRSKDGKPGKEGGSDMFSADRSRLLPVRSLRFHPLLSWESEKGDRTAMLTLVGIAVAIILVALINFVNFFLALLPVRLRAVNVLRVFGAPTGALRLNFLAEAVGYVLLALLLGFYATILMMDMPTEEIFTVSVEVWKNPVPALMVCGVSVVAILSVALWPAHYITSFPPALAAEGFVASPRGRRLRTALIGVQYIVAQVLIFMTLVMWAQYRYMRHADKGFETSTLLVSKLPSQVGYPEGRKIVAAALEREPGILRFGFSVELLPRSYGNWNLSCRLPNGKEARFAQINCDTGLVRTLGLRIVEGGYFDAAGTPKPRSGEAGGDLRPTLINRTSQRVYGLGADSLIPSLPARVCGVVEDFNYCSLHFASRPLIFTLSNWSCPYLYIRMNRAADPERIRQTLAQAVHGIQPSVTPEQVTLKFYDEAQAEVYRKDRNAAITVTLFSLLAIVIALMGVFGLVLFETRQRRREIALRRVMGATSGEILRMINRRYLGLASVCFLGSLPLSVWLAERWLSTFAYRTGGLWLCYVVAFAVVAAVTAVTVTLRARSAANENPAHAVKSEH